MPQLKKCIDNKQQKITALLTPKTNKNAPTKKSKQTISKQQLVHDDDESENSSNDEQEDFPITFEEFETYTNVAEVFKIWLKNKKPNHYEIILESTKPKYVEFVRKTKMSYYKMFYNQPELRESRQRLKLLQLKPNAPKKVREHFYDIPKKYKQKLEKIKPTNSEQSTNPSKTSVSTTEWLNDINDPKPSTSSKATKFMQKTCINEKRKRLALSLLNETRSYNEEVESGMPISLQKFKKHIKSDDLIDNIICDATDGDSKKCEQLKANKVIRERVIRNYYYAYYDTPDVISLHYPVILKACPANIKNLIERTPTNKSRKHVEPVEIISVVDLNNTTNENESTSTRDTTATGITVVAKEQFHEKHEMNEKFPISFKEFEEHTNVLEEAYEYIKRKYPQKYESVIKIKKEYVEKAKRLLYNLFYTHPELRDGQKLQKLKLNDTAPLKVCNKFYDVPKAYQENEKLEDGNCEKSAESILHVRSHHELNKLLNVEPQALALWLVNNTHIYSEEENKIIPVSFGKFEKYTRSDEMVDAIIQDATKGRIDNFKNLQADKNVRQRVLYNYYYGYYLSPAIIRLHYPIQFRACPSFLKAQIENIPDINEEDILEEHLQEPSNAQQMIQPNSEDINMDTEKTSLNSSNKIIENMIEAILEEDSQDPSNAQQMIQPNSEDINIDIENTSLIPSKQIIENMNECILVKDSQEPSNAQQMIQPNSENMNMDTENKSLISSKQIIENINECILVEDSQEPSNTQQMIQPNSEDINMDTGKTSLISSKKIFENMNEGIVIEDSLEPLNAKEMVQPNSEDINMDTENTSLNSSNKIIESINECILVEDSQEPSNAEQMIQPNSEDINMDTEKTSLISSKKIFENMNEGIVIKDSQEPSNAQQMIQPNSEPSNVEKVSEPTRIILESETVQKNSNKNEFGPLNLDSSIIEDIDLLIESMHESPKSTSPADFNRNKRCATSTLKGFQPKRTKLQNISSNIALDADMAEDVSSLDSSEELIVNINNSVEFPLKMYTGVIAHTFGKRVVDMHKIEKHLPISCELFQRNIDTTSVLTLLCKTLSNGNQRLYKTMREDANTCQILLDNFYIQYFTNQYMALFFPINESDNDKINSFCQKTNEICALQSSQINELPIKEIEISEEREQETTLNKAENQEEYNSNLNETNKSEKTQQDQVNVRTFYALQKNNYSKEFLTKYIENKVLPDFEAEVLQKVEKCITKKSVQPEKVYFERWNEFHSLYNMLLNSDGETLKVLTAIATMSFSDFKQYTDILSGRHIYANDILIARCYSYTILERNIWPSNLYFTLDNLINFLYSKNLQLKEFTLEHISPKVLEYKELFRKTNFFECTAQYHKKNVKDFERKEMIKNAQKFYAKCWLHNSWISCIPQITDETLITKISAVASELTQSPQHVIHISSEENTQTDSMIKLYSPQKNLTAKRSSNERNIRKTNSVNENVEITVNKSMTVPNSGSSKENPSFVHETCSTQKQTVTTSPQKMTQTDSIINLCSPRKNSAALNNLVTDDVEIIVNKSLPVTNSGSSEENPSFVNVTCSTQKQTVTTSPQKMIQTDSIIKRYSPQKNSAAIRGRNERNIRKTKTNLVEDDVEIIVNKSMTVPNSGSSEENPSFVHVTCSTQKQTVTPSPNLFSSSSGSVQLSENVVLSMSPEIANQLKAKVIHEVTLNDSNVLAENLAFFENIESQEMSTNHETSIENPEEDPLITEHLLNLLNKNSESNNVELLAVKEIKQEKKLPDKMIFTLSENGTVTNVEHMSEEVINIDEDNCNLMAMSESPESVLQNFTLPNSEEFCSIRENQPFFEESQEMGSSQKATPFVTIRKKIVNNNNTTAKGKSKGNLDFGPQLTHVFRALPVQPVGRKNATSTTATYSMSQDLSLFNSSQVLRAVLQGTEAVKAAKISEKPKKTSNIPVRSKVLYEQKNNVNTNQVNNKADPQEIIQKTELELLLYHKIKKFDYFAALTVAQVIDFELSVIPCGQTYIRMMICTGDEKFWLEGDNLESIFSFFSSQIITSIRHLLQEFNEYHFDEHEKESGKSKTDPLQKICHQTLCHIFNTAIPISACQLQLSHNLADYNRALTRIKRYSGKPVAKVNILNLFNNQFLETVKQHIDDTVIIID